MTPSSLMLVLITPARVAHIVHTPLATITPLDMYVECVVQTPVEDEKR